MAVLGEWQFIDTTTPPPSSGQIRLNQEVQKNATLMWISKTTATNANATNALLAINAGEKLQIADKDEPTKWQTYVVTGTPAPTTTTHMEFPIAWVSGGLEVPEQRIIIEVIAPGNVQVLIDTLPRLQVHTDTVKVKGVLVSNDFAYPFIGQQTISTGLTKRQWYAGQAMMGFIASQATSSNMLKTLAPYCFKAADSMIEFEAKEADGVKPPIVGGV